MECNILPYSVGPLLYCPANSENIAYSLINQKFGTNYSLALCLEDTIADNAVEQAELKLKISLDKIFLAKNNKISKDFYLPKIFIRIRTPEQITKLYSMLKNSISLLTGFIIPKFSPQNSKKYIDSLLNINKLNYKIIYMMPIFESPDLIHLNNRYNILYSLKSQLDKISEYVLNIRVGGNDLCHCFGLRRHSTQTIYDIKTISSILCDIVTVFGRDYIISGPVWEYFNGPDWETGMRKELKLDIVNGFIGKTVIHPNQISVVLDELKVTPTDYDDAVSILNWNECNDTLVSSNSISERMNEQKTHANWAKKILILAKIYGKK